MSIIDRFHQNLRKKLLEDISARMTQLASGAASKTEYDQASTAEKYAAQVSYLRALNEVLDLCEQLDADQHGVKREERTE